MIAWMQKTVFTCFIGTAGILLILGACSGSIEGNLRSGGSAELSLDMSLEPRMAALIRSLSALMGAVPRDRPLIDGAAIARSMAAAPGITGVTLQNRSPISVAGTIRISQIDRFLALPIPAGQDQKRFITYSPASAPGASRLKIELDRNTGPGILALISEDIRDYLSALMAPAATGEALSQTEYLDLVASFYGQPVADEIAAARIRVVIDFPGPITAIRGGTFSGTQARFTIPLANMLVLDPPLEYEVTWK